jgi:hypothetical protein
LELIKEKPRITRKELAEKIGISEDGIKFNLNQLPPFEVRFFRYSLLLQEDIFLISPRP